MNWKEHKKKLLEDPEFRKEYEALEPEYKLASTLIRLRLAKGLTQEQLAKLLNTKQESIARLESGGSLPSLSTVRKVADALDAEVEINLRPKHHPAKDGLATQSSR
ncbi:MAG: helix-turn-helix transcriptional regulator [Chloroflexi bacterium]|jgi:transcriptional regulator with XRE-family HTH domain|nr:helix-turn-helix transcriptional regulator [Chloroflexota bacterium]